MSTSGGALKVKLKLSFDKSPFGEVVLIDVRVFSKAGDFTCHIQRSDGKFAFDNDMTLDCDMFVEQPSGGFYPEEINIELGYIYKLEKPIKIQLDIRSDNDQERWME